MESGKIIVNELASKGGGSGFESISGRTVFYDVQLDYGSTEL